MKSVYTYICKGSLGRFNVMTKELQRCSLVVVWSTYVFSEYSFI